MTERKCVFVIDGDLPVGLIANTAAIMALSLGKKSPEIIGRDVKDGSGNEHAGITTMVFPILRSDTGQLTEIYSKAQIQYSGEIYVIDVNNIAQRTKSYDDYEEQLSTSTNEAIKYLGLCLIGPKKIINKLTGNLPTLR